ncbi:type IV secretion system protein [Rickettsia endosymbiont of Halotydeus destructor]|uniref:type IV secretion system protein n=1 Tax=Rickettsia endosymbiont of Halotydeus destructor TaxID=2996754 RepID=UPI003BAE7641
MKIHKIAKIFIMVYLMFINLNSFGGFGDSCSSLPTTPDGYLEENTAYGYLIRSIDMKTPEDNCDLSDPTLKLCIKNKEGSNPPCTMYILKENDFKKLSELSVDNNPELGANPLLKDIGLTVKRWGSNDLCLLMPTSRGPMPVACKTLSSPAPVPPPPDPNCSNIGASCYLKVSRSQSLFNFSGLAVDCLKESLDKVFFRQNSCSSSEQNAGLTNLTSFPIFQGYLKNAIGAALILYTMFFGFNMILNKDYANPDKIAIFVIKFLFVVYFAVGLGPITSQGGKLSQENGMLTHGLPLLTEFAPEFAQIVFNAGGTRGLCTFDTSKYPAGYKFYALWDSIDCRIGYYFGVNLLYNRDTKGILKPFSTSTPPTNTSPVPDIGTPDSNSPNSLSSVGSLNFFTVIFGFFMAGNIIIVVCGLVFFIIFLSIVLYFITHYLVCMVTIYVMTYISPIFIPMILFTRTKAYFDAWLKVCLSCAIQPAVIAGFIALLLTMYDSAIYKNCEFLRHDYAAGNVKFSTFELRLPNTEAAQCESSLGYKLIQYYSGQGWEERLLILFPVKSIAKDMLVLPELVCVLVFSIIFYYFSKSIGRFASDLTSGPNMDSVTASPTKIVNLAIQAAVFVKDAIQMANGKPPAMSAPGGGAGRSGGPQGGDSGGGSGGSGGLADSVASGGGK